MNEREARGLWKENVRLAQLWFAFIASVNGNRNAPQPTVSASSPTTSRSFHNSAALSQIDILHRFRLLSSFAAASAACDNLRSRRGSPSLAPASSSSPSSSLTADSELLPWRC